MSNLSKIRAEEATLKEAAEQEALDRIALVSQNAKAAWFGLLAALVFTVVTLMGHEDADFFAYGAATTLPVINLDVPPESFFIAAPILITALYVYLHLYLLNLWEVLGDAPPKIRNQPLSKKAYPAMVTSAALWFRNRKRQDGSFDPRPMAWLSASLNWLLVWFFGWAVLGALWWRSMPAHDPVLTYGIGFLLWIAVGIGIRGMFSARRRLRDGAALRGWSLWLFGGAWRGALLLALGAVSFIRIDGTGLASEKMVQDWLVANVSERFKGYWGDEPSEKFTPFLARADLAEKELTVKPADWLDWPQWLQDYELTYRKRNGLKPGAAWEEGQEDAFKRDAKIRRAALTEALKNRDLRGRDLRRANLQDAFLAGADLRLAQMEGAALTRAQMEGADLSGAQMEEAFLFQAQMEGADLSGAQMEGALLFQAQMEGADLRGAQMEGTTLFEVQMEGADLVGAQMEGADLRGAQMEGADLRGAQMERANLFEVQMEGANLFEVQMEGAFLGRAQMEGADLGGAQMEGAFLFQAQMEGADLREAILKSAVLRDMSIARTNLRSADFTDAQHLTQEAVNTAFGDSGTILPEGIRRPRHWDEEARDYWSLKNDAEYQAWIAAGAPPSEPLPEE